MTINKVKNIYAVLDTNAASQNILRTYFRFCELISQCTLKDDKGIDYRIDAFAIYPRILLAEQINALSILHAPPTGKSNLMRQNSDRIRILPLLPYEKALLTLVGTTLRRICEERSPIYSQVMQDEKRQEKLVQIANTISLEIGNGKTYKKGKDLLNFDDPVVQAVWYADDYMHVVINKYINTKSIFPDRGEYVVCDWVKRLSENTLLDSISNDVLRPDTHTFIVSNDKEAKGNLNALIANRKIDKYVSTIGLKGFVRMLRDELRHVVDVDCHSPRQKKKVLEEINNFIDSLTNIIDRESTQQNSQLVARHKIEIQQLEEAMLRKKQGRGLSHKHKAVLDKHYIAVQNNPRKESFVSLVHAQASSAGWSLD